MAATNKRRRDGWEICASAVSEMRAILDDLEEDTGVCERSAALRRQIERVEEVCAAGLSAAGGPDLPGGDPRAAAQGLIDEMPLQEVFQDGALKDAFLSELLLALARANTYASRRELQRKGIAQAKAQGVRFGKPSVPLPENFEQMRRAWRDGLLTMNEAAEKCGLARTTFYNAVQRAEKAAREQGAAGAERAERLQPVRRQPRDAGVPADRVG